MNSAEKQTVLHCLKSMIDETACEECPLYGMTGTDHCEKDCVRLAINTLEQEPCTDAISRKAVLDAISSDRYDYLALLEYVKQLSPVTPQYTDAEIQKMQELEQAEIQKAYELGKAEMQPCTDAISRQAVLEIIRKCHCEEWIKADIGAPIEALSPVTPAEKVGQWIPVSERLPEMGVRVLCACQADLYDVLKLTPEGWFYDTRHTYMFGFVRAWMPLPEPYKASPTGAESEDKE
jgi:hypothetical protein